MHEHDPHGTDTHAPGAKLDAGKLRPWLCISGFPRAMAEVARVTTKGAEKYSDNGWQAVPNGACRYMDAFARHMLALARGEVFDGDTGCIHKAQMAWNLLASLELEMRDNEGMVDLEIDPKANHYLPPWQRDQPVWKADPNGYQKLVLP